LFAQCRSVLGSRLSGGGVGRRRVLRRGLNIGIELSGRVCRSGGGSRLTWSGLGCRIRFRGRGWRRVNWFICVCG
jgi:hypothetical protein